MEYISTTLQNLVHQTAFMNLTGRQSGHDRSRLHFSVSWQFDTSFEPLLAASDCIWYAACQYLSGYYAASVKTSANGTGGLLYYFYIAG